MTASKTPVNPNRMTTREAAEYLGLSMSCLETWRSNQNEDGPPYMKLGRRVFYQRFILDEWMRKNTVTPGA